MKLTKQLLESIMSDGIKFFSNYSVPVLVFDAVTREVHTATGVIIRKSAHYMLATAKHVLDGYLGLGADGRLQIGGDGYVLKNIDSERIKLSDKVDFGIVKLTNEDFRAINWNALDFEVIHFGPVRTMDLVAYTGFPGCWKNVLSHKELALGRFRCIGAIETVEADQFSMRVDDRRYDLEEGNLGELTEAGGISGAPVFSLFDFHKSRRRSPLLVGWIHEGMVWGDLAQKHYAVRASMVEPLFGM